MNFEEFLKSKHVMAEFLKSRPMATDQRLQTGGNRPTATDQRLQNGSNKPTVLDQIGQQKSLQKVPQERQLKLKWSSEKRDTVSFRALLGIKHQADPLSWGTNDELEALAKMYNVQFMVFETAQAVESQWISIGEDDSPKICLINTDNQHFDILVPQVDGNYSQLPQTKDGNCLYHSVIPGLLKLIPENERHNYTPKYLREKISNWINDDTNFYDGAERAALDSLEQQQASSGRPLEIDQVVDQIGQHQQQKQQPRLSYQLCLDTKSPRRGTCMPSQTPKSDRHFFPTDPP
jgi:hypothetical protein